MRPALVKLGGSCLTDKAREEHFHRGAAKRLVGEVARSGVPCVLLHGAGSFGHPHVKRHLIGIEPADDDAKEGVAATLASVGRLHGDIVQLAHDAGLRPVSIPLHVQCTSEGGMLMDFPLDQLEQLLREGYTPVLCGTLVRDDALGWRVVSADEILELLAEELDPRIAIFCTDVDGVFDRHPEAPGATLLPHVQDLETVDKVAAFDEGPGADVTGRMRGKLHRAFTVAESCPTIILNGTARGRLLEALKGKAVPCTRVS